MVDGKRRDSLGGEMCPSHRGGGGGGGGGHPPEAGNVKLLHSEM